MGRCGRNDERMACSECRWGEAMSLVLSNEEITELGDA